MSAPTESKFRAAPGPAIRHRPWQELGRRRWLAPAIPHVRGPSACLRRDSTYRRLLLGADLLALAFALCAALASGGSRGLAWAALPAAMVLILGAKLAGLYDRDPALLRKTTLEESPVLFQLATLCALLVWLLAGATTRVHPAPQAVAALWGALAIGLIAARSASRALALRIVPPERCMVIGDESAAETIRSRLSGGGGVKASLVAHVATDKLEPWSAQSFSASRLAEIGRLARTLDVHRAIVAPRSAEAAETLDVVRSLTTIGVRVSVLPRLLEVVGSAVEFDDLHGLCVMGVRSFELTRSSKALKRALDLALAPWACSLLWPPIAVIALAIRLESPGPVLFSQLRMGRHSRGSGSTSSARWSPTRRRRRRRCGSETKRRTACSRSSRTRG